MHGGHLAPTLVANQAASAGTLVPGSALWNKHIATKQKGYVR